MKASRVMYVSVSDHSSRLVHCLGFPYKVAMCTGLDSLLSFNQ